MPKKKTTKKAPDQAPEQAPDSAPEPVVDEWAKLWETLIAIEVKNATYGTTGSAIRADSHTHLSVVMESKSKVPIGVRLSRTDKRTGEPLKIQHFIPDGNISGYQFGENYAELTSMDLEVDKPAPAIDDDDTEVLQRTTPRSSTPTGKPKVRKRPEEMGDDLEPDADADAQMAALQRQMDKSKAEEEADSDVERDLDEENLGDPDPVV